MKPVLQVKTLLCYKDEHGNIFEHRGVVPYLTWVFSEQPEDIKVQDFTGIIGDYTIQVKLIVKEKDL